MTAFCDSFALIAWINGRDSFHGPVVDYLAGFRGKITVTEWIFVEVADGLCHPNFRAAVVEMIRRIRSSEKFEIVALDWEVYRAGFELYGARADKEWSLTDCISFAVMSQRGITDALTADHHFEQAGFRPVFKKPDERRG